MMPTMMVCERKCLVEVVRVGHDDDGLYNV
jgi:hypothetical protein